MKKAHLSRLFLCASIMALLLGFDSCKSDNTDTVTPTTAIEGSYKITTLTADPKVLGTFSDLIAASKLLFTNTTCLNDLTISFNTGGTATTNNPSSCQSIPVPVSTFTGIDASSKWVLNASKLTVTKGDGTKTEYTVVSTSPTLKLQWQAMLNYPAPDPTVYTFNMELKK